MMFRAKLIMITLINKWKITKNFSTKLNNNKNQIALVEEARLNPDMYVAIVGEGENESFLKKKIDEYGLEKRVKLFGFLPAVEVLKGFNTFELPSIKNSMV